MRKGTVCPPRVAIKVAYDDDLLKRDPSTVRVFLVEIAFSKGPNKIEREIVEKSRILKIYLTKFT